MKKQSIFVNSIIGNWVNKVALASASFAAPSFWLAVLVVKEVE